MSNKVLTPAQFYWLDDLAAYRDPTARLGGKSAHGGAAGTVMSLRKRGYIDGDGALTLIGEKVVRTARDLKLLDELLLDYMHHGTSRRLEPDDLLRESSATRDALCRLRDAWRSGELPVMTLTWADYFKRRKGTGKIGKRRAL